MCGLFGYVGDRNIKSVLLKGLKRLEYRGYDSTGIGLLEDEKLKVFKREGKLDELITLLNGKEFSSSIGIGHTRWATHGEPNDSNSHPQFSNSKKLAIVHNGIIENYSSLKKELLSKGYVFQSQTDTEVLINFIENIQINDKCDLSTAIRLALKRIVGAYSIVILSEDEPGTLFAVRRGSPLIIGVGRNEHFLTSDASSIAEYTNKAIYMDDFQIAVVKSDEIILSNIDNITQTSFVENLDLELSSIEKGDFKHFMLKEIYEQPKTISNGLRGRLNSKTSKIILGGITQHRELLLNAHRIVIIACGTSWHAGFTAKYFIEDICRIPVEVEFASEFRYKNPIIHERDIFIAVSQSGETADTISAISMLKERGAVVLGMCNVVGSTISRESHEGLYTRAGYEIAVASTKSFTSQLIALNLIGLYIAQENKTISSERLEKLLLELNSIPTKIQECLLQDKKIQSIAEKYCNSSSFLFMGRGANYPIALEGALKLKEVSYIHAEGYATGEMKHGPIALIDKDIPSLFLCPSDMHLKKVLSNIQEVKARKGKIISIVTDGNTEVESQVDDIISIPRVSEEFIPILSVIPLQLFAYYVGVFKGYNVDQPRNLAKSVTVE
ncbi:glutamine--fructose-6-phosphate transaminase (isomerizing) [Ichthyobacterium seriolicida]|uniref:Glutamine--fructose-6-phosphate aminotransferase [isomerizing] n=1 Tax=Ichthyobacterium seriolicida TaxID=242600 RepID=A0A1J1E9D9_9FLAO|nr:glutamine--fructose-6-phosphate transaminase (isomerizing) [Ichthyobacterium seriolicida]BAV94144.1 glucosamine--fructose-6-phosphate aminotransferase [Ichthyobacterium seriolicida]